jgi:hypothetical protein
MKRIVVFVILAFSAFGLVFAQSRTSSSSTGAAQTPAAVNPVAEDPAVAAQTPPVAKPEKTSVAPPQQRTATAQTPQVVKPVVKTPQNTTQQTETQKIQLEPTVTEQTRTRQTAQVSSRPDPQTSYQFNPPPVKNRDTVYIIPGAPKRIINGTLGVDRGMVTLTDSKGVNWYVLGLDRFIGFIDGLDMGKEVELEGYSPAAPGSSQERFFQATKLILDDMDYDLVPPEGSSVTVRPRKEPKPEPPKVLEHKHIPSQWAPNYEPSWMQSIDLNAFWKDDTKEGQRYKDRGRFKGIDGSGTQFFD